MPRPSHKPSPYRHTKTFLITVFATTVIAFAAIMGRPTLHLALAAWRDAAVQPKKLPISTGILEDASHLNPTPMKVVVVPNDLTAAQIQLKNILKQAQYQGKKVAISGSRHTMEMCLLVRAVPSPLTTTVLPMSRIGMSTR